MLYYGVSSEMRIRFLGSYSLKPASEEYLQDNSESFQDHGLHRNLVKALFPEMCNSTHFASIFRVCMKPNLSIPCRTAENTCSPALQVWPPALLRAPLQWRSMGTTAAACGRKGHPCKRAPVSDVPGRCSRERPTSPQLHWANY